MWEKQLFEKLIQLAGIQNFFFNTLRRVDFFMCEICVSNSKSNNVQKCLRWKAIQVPDPRDAYIFWISTVVWSILGKLALKFSGLIKFT